MSEFAIIFISYFVATLALWLAHYFLLRRSSSEEKSDGDFFEIHVLINPKLHSFLRKWVDSKKDFLLKLGFLNARYMATRTSVGNSRIQPMVTCLVRCNDHAESVEWTQKLSQIVKDALKSEGIVREKSEYLVRKKSECIVRKKSEGLVRKKSEGLVHETSKKLRRVSGTGYFESHCKVTGKKDAETGKVTPIDTVETWREFAKLCASSAWTNRKISVPLLSNFDSAKGKFPVTTLRMYETDLETFLEEHNKFIAFLKEQGYEIMNPHIEESHYDNNPFTDLDWAIFPRYADAYKDYVLGKSFNKCFRWVEPQDFTEEAYNPPEGWLEQVTAFESAQAT
jgi:hypothetical protein